MLRTPIKLALILAAITGIILGIHGLWVYFNYVETILKPGEMNKLFIAFEVPIMFREAIEWMSLKGLQSFFVPALITIAGIFCWYLQSRIIGLNFNRYLRKLHLW